MLGIPMNLAKIVCNFYFKSPTFTIFKFLDYNLISFIYLTNNPRQVIYHKYKKRVHEIT